MEKLRGTVCLMSFSKKSFSFQSFNFQFFVFIFSFRVFKMTYFLSSLAVWNTKEIGNCILMFLETDVFRYRFQK